VQLSEIASRAQPSERLEKDISINNSSARSFLTKKEAHLEILDLTGATVVVRGVYRQPHEPVSDPTDLLHLHIEAPSSESLMKAVAEIEKIMNAQQDAPAFECKVYANVPDEFTHRAKGKIVGPGGQFVKYIQRKANCRVQLRGIGSCYKEGPDYREADEALHLHIVAPNERCLEQARKQAENLLTHVRTEYEKILGYRVGERPMPIPVHPPPPGGAPPPPGGAPPPPPPGGAPPPPPPTPSAPAPPPPSQPPSYSRDEDSGFSRVPPPPAKRARTEGAGGSPYEVS